MITTYFQNHVVTLTYEPEWELGAAVMHGFPGSQDFRDAITRGMQMLEEYKPLRWLADNRKLKVIRQADQDWFLTFASPKIITSTIRRNAMIVSEDIFNKMAVEQIVKKAGNLQSMLLKEFYNEQQAMTWLKQPITFAP